MLERKGFLDKDNEVQTSMERIPTNDTHNVKDWVGNISANDNNIVEDLCK